jgi:hypothetical protein
MPGTFFFEWVPNLIRRNSRLLQTDLVTVVERGRSAQRHQKHCSEILVHPDSGCEARSVVIAQNPVKAQGERDSLTLAVHAP